MQLFAGIPLQAEFPKPCRKGSRAFLKPREPFTDNIWDLLYDVTGEISGTRLASRVAKRRLCVLQTSPANLRQSFFCPGHVYPNYDELGLVSPAPNQFGFTAPDETPQVNVRAVEARGNNCACAVRNDHRQCADYGECVILPPRAHQLRVILFVFF